MLYLVATPIGNLEDLSPRQARTIAEAEIILAEDTRTAGILLERIVNERGYERNKNQQVVSYYKEKEFEKLPQVLSWVNSNKSVVLISESGLPLVSDPGYLLVKQVIRAGIPFTVVPGASAVTTALVYSGFDPSRHLALGFLPKKEGEVRKLLEKVTETLQLLPKTSVVFFESPERIQDTLRVMEEIMPGAKVAVCRELTKKFEEVLRGSPGELKGQNFRGEITVVFSLEK